MQTLAAPKIPAAAMAIALFAMVFGFTEASRAAGQYVKVDYPASTNQNELQVAVTYTLWIPDGVKTLRGLVVHQHGAGITAAKDGAAAAYDLHWQALAKKWDCALLGPSYHVTGNAVDLAPGGSEYWFDVRRGSEKTFLKALDDLAGKSGHAELTSVPWVLWGHSGGGIWANGMAILHPDRVIALYLRSGTVTMFRLRHHEFTDIPVPESVYKIPTMVNPGAKEEPANDVFPGNLATFKNYRAKGALIGLAIDPCTGHECGDSRYLAIPFLDLCLSLRLPDRGSKDQTLKPMDTMHAWLAPFRGETAVAESDFKGNLTNSVWLPNEAIAKAWMEYTKTGAVGDATPPPAPTDVKATSKEDAGTEVTWEAEADFESGIAQFIILRDGKELAKVPENPAGKFGRPLFQGMTYNDTPNQPVREMKFLDAAAKPGERHAYSVITVNSVGLKSTASTPSASAAAVELVIIHANYGDLSSGVVNDVTGKLADMVESNMLEVAVNNYNFGDPTEAVKKQLRVIYTIGGKTRTQTVSEGETLNISPTGIQAPIALWPGSAPGALGSTSNDIPTITPYLPDPARATGAAMIVCPGGGYVSLGAKEGNDYALWLNRHGVTCFVLKSRLATAGYHHPAFWQDASRAMRLVRAGAAD